MNWLNIRKNSKFSRFFNEKKNYDWYLVIIVSLLSLGGIAFLASASSIISTARYDSEIYLLIRQVSLGLWIGFVLAFIFSQFDYHNLYKFRKHLLILSFFFLGWMAIAEILYKFHIIAEPESFRILTIKPISSNGATRWLEFAPSLRFQPVEFTKIALLVYVCGYFYKSENESKVKQEITFLSLKKELYAIVASLILIIMQPDLGSALLVFAVSFGALYICEVPRKILMSIIAFMIGFVLISVIPTSNTNGVNTNYRTGRVQTFINKITGNATTTTDSNLHTERVEDAIQNGGLWGEGYGNSQYKKRGLIPEIHTDAIIAVIGEEMGFFKTLIFLALYLILAIRGLKVATEAPDLFGRGLAAGIVFWITGQTLLNIMSFLSLTPLSGVPLPFVSYGSTSLLINLTAMGILINISSFSKQQSSKTTLNTPRLRTTRPKFTIM